MAKSIINNNKVCFICGSGYMPEKHHCIFGRSERRKAESDGLWVYLCRYHHHAVHNENVRLKKMLQNIAETSWMEHNNASEEDFIKRYGRSYLNGSGNEIEHTG